jgi:tRNA pseudouridine38-40 synthase
MNQPVGQKVDGLIRYRINLAYDGSAYYGWARQSGHKTVQQSLLDALTLVFGESTNDFSMRVAGRTDAGVHAFSQVAHIDVTAAQIKRLGRTKSIAFRLNSILDRDIRIHSFEIAPPGFHARFSATFRRYRFRIADGPVAKDALQARYTLWLAHELDLDLMRDGAKEFIGLHDFNSFCKARVGATTIRNMKSIKISRNPELGGVIEIELIADAFCHNMVRAIVGGLIAVAQGSAEKSEITHALKVAQKRAPFKVATPEGLTLVEIGYPADDKLEEQAAITRKKRQLNAN